LYAQRFSLGLLIIFANEVMFYLAFVSLPVCLSVSNFTYNNQCGGLILYSYYKTGLRPNKFGLGLGFSCVLGLGLALVSCDVGVEKFNVH